MTAKPWSQYRAERAQRRAGLQPSGRHGTPSRASRALRAGDLTLDDARRLAERRAAQGRVAT